MTPEETIREAWAASGRWPDHSPVLFVMPRKPTFKPWLGAYSVDQVEPVRFTRYRRRDGRRPGWEGWAVFGEWRGVQVQVAGARIPESEAE